MLEEVLDKVHRSKYERYALRSMVEDSRRLTWCPSPDCEHAVESLTEASSAPMDVVCKCSHAFCFNCREEAHRPVGRPACWCSRLTCTKVVQSELDWAI